MANVYDKLKEMNITLPAPPPKGGVYTPVMEFGDHLLYCSGCGPMGSTTAQALATYGVRVHVVNRFNWTANSPRAHITNQRALEVLRDLDLEQDAKLYGAPQELMGDNVFCTSLAGEELGRLRT